MNWILGYFFIGGFLGSYVSISASREGGDPIVCWLAGVLTFFFWPMYLLKAFLA